MDIKKENSTERSPLQEKSPDTKKVKIATPEEEKPKTMVVVGVGVDETDGKILDQKSVNSFDEFVRII